MVILLGRKTVQRPLNSPTRTPPEIEEIVKLVRLNLYNQELFSGAQAIRWKWKNLTSNRCLPFGPSTRILSSQGLTHRRTGRYESKGKAYPRLPALCRSIVQTQSRIAA